MLTPTPSLIVGRDSKLLDTFVVFVLWFLTALQSPCRSVQGTLASVLLLENHFCHFLNLRFVHRREPIILALFLPIMLKNKLA